jgi:hypothetical protein
VPALESVPALAMELALAQVQVMEPDSGPVLVPVLALESVPGSVLP